LGPIGGVIADRVDKRKMLYLTQSVSAATAIVLGVVVLAGAVELWMVYAMALTFGLAASVDNPTRQSFVLEMVGRDQLTNAISLHSTLVNAARIVGPAIAGLLIVTIGIGWCFVFNAISYLAVIVALIAMRAEELQPAVRQPRAAGQLRDGLSYVRATPAVLTPLLMMAVAGTFAYEYQVVLPLLAKFTFDGDAQTFATMTSAMGVGAVVGGLYTAFRLTRPAIALARTAALFGLVQVITSLAPNLMTVLVGLAVLGAAGVSFLALGNSTLQLATTPGMRGRVMGLWAVAFIGSTPIGGPIMGWVGDHVGPRWALGLGGVAVLATAVFSVKSLASVDGTARAESDPGAGATAAKMGL
jgi:MFS family permease